MSDLFYTYLGLRVLYISDVPSPSVAAAVNDALVSHAALRGLNMDSFGFGATGVHLHTAEAAILQRKAPSEDALGLHSVSIQTLR